MTIITEASVAYRALNGIACIYKPAGVHVEALKTTIFQRLCIELNQLKTRPPDLKVDIVGPTNSPMEVKVVTDLSDHPLVVGSRYRSEFFKARYVNHLRKYTSGVLLLAINKGTRDASKLNEARLTKAYKIHGIFGKATDTYFKNGAVVEKATFKHVTREKIDKVVAYMQSMHQKKMFEMSRIDMNTQAGFELAKMGPIRPSNTEIPVLYGIKCVHFESPNFIIEVQCMNEYEKYLHTIIHDLGIQLKTVAYCNLVQCIRYGTFTVENALLMKHWDLKNIIESIKFVQDTMKQNVRLIRPESPALAQYQ